LISAVPGILGVPALYLFCRELAGKRTAVCAGFLFAVGHWNVRLSRWGWDEVAMTTLQIVSAYFLVRGFQRREPRSFVWAGIMMGFCLYTYIASRLALAAALACLGGYIVPGRDHWGERFKPLLTFALAVTLTVAPLSVFYLQHPNLFTVRTGEVNIFRQLGGPNGLAPLLTNIKSHLLMFHVRGDVFPKHDLPYAPLLDPVTGGLFLIGLGMSLWRWRSPGYALCQWWFWIGLLAGVLSDNGGFPHAYRTGNVAPIAMAMAALPLGWLLSRAGVGEKAHQRYAVLTLITGVIGAIIGLNYHNFFVRWANLPALWDDMLTSRGTTVARYILREPQQKPTFVSRWVLDAGFGTLMRNDASGNETRTKNWNPDYWNADTNPPLTGMPENVVYFCNPDWERWMRSWYPHAGWTVLRNGNGDAYSAVMEIPATDLGATQGLYRRVVRDDQPAESATPFASQVVNGLRGTWTLFEGYYYVHIPEFLTFGAPDGGIAGLWLDGRRILESGERVSSEESADLGMRPVWILTPGEVDRPPPLMLRQRWLRGSEVPRGNLAPSADSTQTGLSATVYAGADWTGEPVATLEPSQPMLPSHHPPPPYGARWSGVLRADLDGEYTLGVAMDDGGDVTLDGRRVIEDRGGYAEAVLPLSVGWHPIEIRYFDTGGGAYLSLLWIRPHDKEIVGNDQWSARQFAPINEGAFYRVPFAGRGLLARYYSDPHFHGPPFLSVVENGQWLTHHQGEHFSVELEGYWYFPESARYWLGLNSDDGSWLYLDGELVVDNGGTHGFAPTGKEIEVTRGLHHVLVRYFQDTGGAGLQLLWAPNGGPPYQVPPVFLYPTDPYLTRRDGGS